MTNQSDYSINYVTSSNDTDKTVVTAKNSNDAIGRRENFGILFIFSLDDEIARRHFATEGSVINELSSMD